MLGLGVAADDCGTVDGNVVSTPGVVGAAGVVADGIVADLPVNAAFD